MYYDILNETNINSLVSFHKYPNDIHTWYPPLTIPWYPQAFRQRVKENDLKKQQAPRTVLGESLELGMTRNDQR